MAVCPDYRTLFESQGQYRDIVFDVVRPSGQFGQRGPTHEFPFRQLPLSEFLGRKARRYSVEGYFNGPDCFAQARALSQAVEIPSPGTLRHPVFGTQNVKVETCNIDANVEDHLFEVRT